MQLVLLRHADKIHSPIDPDVDLSPIGHQQAARLIMACGQSFPKPDIILCSPKKRAQNTVAPLSQHLNLKTQVRTELDEQYDKESRAAFKKRIIDFTEALARQSQTTVVCTHADWLAAAIQLIPSDLTDPEFETHFQPAQFRVFEFDGVLWHYAGQ